MNEPLHKAINGREFYPTQTRYVVKITEEEYDLLMACSHRMDIGGIAYYLRSKSHATGDVHLARTKFCHGIAFDLRREDDDESNRDHIGHLKSMLARVSPHGYEVSPLSPAATCFCALGRIAKESGAKDTSFTGIESFLSEYLYPFNVTKRMVFDRNDFASASRAGMKAGLDLIRSIFPPRPDK